MTFFLILFLSGIFISTIAAWVSIIGLTAIFPGAVFAVTAMAVALEVGKLTAVSWLYRFWKKTNWLLKMYFTIAILILSIINSIGVFGYLSKAHIEGTQGIEAGSDQIALIDEQIAIERQSVDAAKASIRQMDAAVNNLSAKEQTTERAVQVRSSQRKERALLNSDIVASNKKIIELQQQKSKLNVSQRKLETDVGPIKYVAQFIYGNKDASTIEHAVTLLILILIFVFDPLAILMLVAANIQLNEIKKKTDIGKSATPTTNIPLPISQQKEEQWIPAEAASVIPESDIQPQDLVEVEVGGKKLTDIAVTKKIINQLRTMGWHK